jgi:hypothetical protein
MGEIHMFKHHHSLLLATFSFFISMNVYSATHKCFVVEGVSDSLSGGSRQGSCRMKEVDFTQSSFEEEFCARKHIKIKYRRNSNPNANFLNTIDFYVGHPNDRENLFGHLLTKKLAFDGPMPKKFSTQITTLVSRKIVNINFQCNPI